MMNSSELIDRLGSMGIKSYTAAFTTTTSKLFVNDLNSFIEIAKENTIQHVYYTVDVLSSEDVETSFITDEMLSRVEVSEDLEKEFRKDVSKHNKQVVKLRDLVGKEQGFVFCFAHQGILISFRSVNDDLYPEDPDDLIKEIADKYRAEIREHRYEELQNQKKTAYKLLTQIEDQIISLEEFKLCSNDTNRKIFALSLFEKMEEYFSLNKMISIYDVQEYVSYLWAKHKDNLKKSK